MLRVIFVTNCSQITPPSMNGQQLERVSLAACARLAQLLLQLQELPKLVNVRGINRSHSW